MISDGPMISKQISSLDVGLRGICCVEINLLGSEKDLHSGIFGGIVVNPANELSRLIASCKNEKNIITIPGFYDDVVVPSSEERSLLNKGAFFEDELKKNALVSNFSGEFGFTNLERIGIRPTMDVNGLWSGYQGHGIKTILPSTASAKISFRLVPNQSASDIFKKFSAYATQQLQQFFKVKITDVLNAEPFLTNTKGIAYKAAQKSIEIAFGSTPIPVRSGGGIPICNTIKNTLGVDVILMGFGSHYDNIHGPNENFDLDSFFRGIQAASYFNTLYFELAKKAP